MDNDFTYSNGYFYDQNGQVVPLEKLQEYFDYYEKQHTAATLESTLEIIENGGSCADWEMAMALALRDALVTNFRLINPTATENDYKALELQLTKHLQDLRKVTQQLAAGQFDLDELADQSSTLLAKVHAISKQVKKTSPIKPTPTDTTTDNTDSNLPVTEPVVEPVAGPQFGFNQNSQRYHYLDGPKKGQFIGKTQVRETVQSYLNGHKNELSTIHNQLANGEINIAQWELKVVESLRSAAINAYRIANPKATTQDWAKVETELRKQFVYLRNFTKQIQKGALSLAQIDARADLYIQSVWSFYSEATRDSHQEAGYSWERRFIGSKHPCPECPGYAEAGWQPIGTLPKIGEKCTCKVNCKCYFEFSQSSGKPQERFYTNLYTMINSKHARSSYAR